MTKSKSSRAFTLYCRKHAGMDLKTPRLVLVLWSQFIAENLLTGHVVSYRSIGRFKLAKSNQSGMFKITDKHGVIHTGRRNTTRVYVSFKASRTLKGKISKSKTT